MTRLYRPVGLKELALMWDSGCREFPPRLPEQPIFYPVTSAEYATQIARDWNTKSPSQAGYLTSFDVDDNYLLKFDRHVVGSAIHEEYWIPANELDEFNKSIRGPINVDAAYFGDSFAGFIAVEAGLKGKNATDQFVELARSWETQPDRFRSGDLDKPEGGVSELPVLAAARLRPRPYRPECQASDTPRVNRSLEPKRERSRTACWIHERRFQGMNSLVMESL
jgi:hypothetical protein